MLVINQEGGLTTNLPNKPGMNYDPGPGFFHITSTAYGSSKLFLERAGKSLVESKKIKSFISIRIGCINPGENRFTLRSSLKDLVIGDEEKAKKAGPDSPFLAVEWLQQMWLSNEDMTTLFAATIWTDHVGFDVVNGVSNNTGMKWDIKHTTNVLGWIPKDNIANVS